MIFQSSVKKYSHGIEVVFTGRLNEAAQLPKLDLDSSTAVTFDWRGVTYINSVGIGIWIKYLKEIAKVVPGKQLRFVQCPYLVVEQMGKVQGFVVPDLQVESFYVPYLCEQCEESRAVLFENGKHYNNGDSKVVVTAPVVTCPRCRAAMEMDVFENRYFGFFDIIKGVKK